MGEFVDLQAAKTFKKHFLDEFVDLHTAKNHLSKIQKSRAQSGGSVDFPWGFAVLWAWGLLMKIRVLNDKISKLLQIRKIPWSKVVVVLVFPVVLQCFAAS